MSTTRFLQVLVSELNMCECTTHGWAHKLALGTMTKRTVIGPLARFTLFRHSPRSTCQSLLFGGLLFRHFCWKKTAVGYVSKRYPRRMLKVVNLARSPPLQLDVRWTETLGILHTDKEQSVTLFHCDGAPQKKKAVWQNTVNMQWTSKAKRPRTCKTFKTCHSCDITDSRDTVYDVIMIE